MASVVVENFDGRTPLREDGSHWPFMLTMGDTAILADHNADLIGALDANYLTVPERNAKSALLARGALALNFAAIHQAELLDEHLAVHDEGTVTECDLSVILAPRSEPLQLSVPWTHPVTLVGIATDYAPYTALPSPTGNIMLINPYSDVTLLQTLDGAGVLEYLVHQDA